MQWSRCASLQFRRFKYGSRLLWLVVGGWWLVVAFLMKSVTKDITVQIPTEPMGCYANVCMYEGWNFNSGNFLFTADTK